MSTINEAATVQAEPLPAFAVELLEEFAEQLDVEPWEIASLADVDLQHATRADWRRLAFAAANFNALLTARLERVLGLV